MKRHRVTREAQTWGNVPPYRPVTLRRARCTCGWTGLWCYYPENVEKRCPQS